MYIEECILYKILQLLFWWLVIYNIKKVDLINFIFKLILKILIYNVGYVNQVDQ